jgi:prepilin-type N-terminal cleavage/methylation domain-containing protein
MFRIHPNSRSGQSLMEVLVAVAIGAVLIVAAMGAIVPALLTNQQSAPMETGVSLGAQLMNNVRVWSEGDWHGILSLATGTANQYYLNASSSPFTMTAASSSGSSTAYQYYRAITVTSTSAASGTLSNFPMLVSSTLASWESSSTGGSARIQNLCTAPNGGQEPCDLIFTSDSGCSSPLNFETESYTSSTGALIDWVNVAPSLSAGTVIYACYGNSTVISDQSHPSSTWDANYKGVWHLPDGTTLNASDSTQYANHVSSGTAPAYTGKIDGGAWFNGTNNYLDVPSSTASATLNFSTPYTLQAWAQTTATSVQYIVSKGGSGLNGYGFGMSGACGAGKLCLEKWGLANISLGTYPTSTIGTFHQITIVGSSTLTTGYIDALVNGTSSAGTLNFGVQDFIIGKLSPNANYWYGAIDEVRVSTVIRSPSWILTEYNNQSSPSTFYAVGSETTNSGGGGGGTVGSESLVLGASTYSRYFYLSDVYRTAGNIVTSGGVYDPSTKLVTVVYTLPSGATSSISAYLTRHGENIYRQTDWSGGPGASGPATTTGSQFVTSSNIDYSTTTGSIYLAIPGY